MSTDLQDLFDQTGHNAPPPRLDPDHVVRRGRRLRARRRVAVGATALVGAGAVAVGAGIVASALPAGNAPGSGTTVLSPGGASSGVRSQPAVPTTTPTEKAKDRNPPRDLARVALRDPAPGFPLRRGPDTVDRHSDGFEPRPQWMATFLLGVSPPSAAGIPTGPEVSIVVARKAPPVTEGRIEGQKIVGSAQVAGVTGQVTRWTEKGTARTSLYFSTGKLSVRIYGFGGVTTEQLVALGDALTGLR